jgi:hypothetical protein
MLRHMLRCMLSHYYSLPMSYEESQTCHNAQLYWELLAKLDPSHRFFLMSVLILLTVYWLTVSINAWVHVHIGMLTALRAERVSYSAWRSLLPT